MLSLPFVERDSNVGEEPGLEREGAQEQLGGTGGGVQGGMYVIPAIKTLCPKGLGGVSDFRQKQFSFERCRSRFWCDLE